MWYQTHCREYIHQTGSIHFTLSLKITLQTSITLHYFFYQIIDNLFSFSQTNQSHRYKWKYFCSDIYENLNWYFNFVLTFSVYKCLTEITWKWYYFSQSCRCLCKIIIGNNLTLLSRYVLVHLSQCTMVYIHYKSKLYLEWEWYMIWAVGFYGYFPAIILLF